MDEPVRSETGRDVDIYIKGFVTINGEQESGFIDFTMQLDEKQEFTFDQLEPMDEDRGDIEIHVDHIEIK